MKKAILGLFIILLLPFSQVGAQDSEVVVDDPTPNSTMLGDLIEKIKFKEDSFGDKTKITVVKSLEKLEAWRNKVDASLDAPIQKVEDDRKDSINQKPEIKAMSFLHLWALKILQLIVSAGFIFYGLVVVIAIVVIKKLFAFIAWIFRRRAERA